MHHPGDYLAIRLIMGKSLILPSICNLATTAKLALSSILNPQYKVECRPKEFQILFPYNRNFLPNVVLALGTKRQSLFFSVWPMVDNSCSIAT